MKYPFDNVQTVDAGEISLATVIHGGGAPVLLVHGGGPTDMRTWGPQIEPFAAHYRLITYSQRGHYPNPWPENSSSVDRAAFGVRDLAGLLRAIGLERVHLIGHSYGADLVLRFAVEYPEMVHTVVVAEPALMVWLVDLPGGKKLFEQYLAMAMPAVRAAREGDVDRAIQLFIASVTGGPSTQQLPAALERRLKDNVRALAAHPTALEGFDTGVSRDAAAAIKAPMLSLIGEQSPAMYLLTSRELARCVPDLEQVQIAGAAHLLHGMNPASFNAAVLAFLAEHAPE